MYHHLQKSDYNNVSYKIDFMSNKRVQFDSDNNGRVIFYHNRGKNDIVDKILCTRCFGDTLM